MIPLEIEREVEAEVTREIIGIAIVVTKVLTGLLCKTTLTVEATNMYHIIELQ